MKANERQVGGKHYDQGELPQHWDLAIQYNWDFFQYQITKYVMRWKKKGGVQDLQKAAHFLEKYIENAEHFSAPPIAPEIMLQVPSIILYEGGSFAEDFWQCRICHLHMRSKRGELPEHSADDCLAQQAANHAKVQKDS